jgi:hypothetical protein
VVDKRKHLRIRGIQAQFEFEHKIYDILDISPEAVLIGVPDGFDEEVVQKMGQGKFGFELIETQSGSRMRFCGEVVRTIREAEDRKVSAIAIHFSEK